MYHSQPPDVSAQVLFMIDVHTRNGSKDAWMPIHAWLARVIDLRFVQHACIVRPPSCPAAWNLHSHAQ
jgi:hypothetical protein